MDSLQSARVSRDDKDDVGTIAPELLLQEIRSGRNVLLIDVRRSHEAQGEVGRLAGARHISMYQLRGRAPELAGHEHDLVVTISTNGRRARAAAFVLRLAGFEGVVALEGGMSRWNELGYPVEHA